MVAPYSTPVQLCSIYHSDIQIPRNFDSLMFQVEGYGEQYQQEVLVSGPCAGSCAHVEPTCRYQAYVNVADGLRQ